MTVLDKINWEILNILKENSRESLSSISKKVNLSRPSVSERILRMEEKGIIKKYTIEIGSDFKTNTIIFYTLLSNTKTTGEHFFEYMHTLPEVKSIDVITGKASYLVKSEVNSMTEMQDFLKKLLQVSTIESFISLKHIEID